MRHQFGGQITYALALEVCSEHAIRAAGEIQRGLRQTFVHRQCKPITRDAAFIAQSLTQGLSQGQRRIFHRVVLVNVQIAITADG